MLMQNIIFQELLIFKELYESDSPCHVTKFKSKIVPPPDVIRESLLESKKVCYDHFTHF